MTWTTFEPAFPRNKRLHIYVCQSRWSRLPVWKSSITFSYAILGKTPLDEWSDRHRDLYHTTHNTHKRPTSITAEGFEPAVPASKRPQTHALDRAAIAIDIRAINANDIVMCVQRHNSVRPTREWVDWLCNCSERTGNLLCRTPHL